MREDGVGDRLDVSRILHIVALPRPHADDGGRDSGRPKDARLHAASVAGVTKMKGYENFCGACNAIRGGLPVGSEHFELGPVERVSDGALHFGMPGGHEGPEQLTDSRSRDDVEVVKVGHGGSAESLPPPQGNLL